MHFFHNLEESRVTDVFSVFISSTQKIFIMNIDILIIQILLLYDTYPRDTFDSTRTTAIPATSGRVPTWSEIYATQYM